MPSAGCCFLLCMRFCGRVLGRMTQGSHGMLAQMLGLNCTTLTCIERPIWSTLATL